MKIRKFTDIIRESFTHPLSSSVVTINNKGEKIVLREGGNSARVNLSGANLSGVKLVGVDLSEANLSGANLSGADFRKAKLRGANFKGAIITRTNFENAILDSEQIETARYTIEPMGIKVKVHGMPSLKTKTKGRK